MARSCLASKRVLLLLRLLVCLSVTLARCETVDDVFSFPIVRDGAHGSLYSDDSQRLYAALISLSDDSDGEQHHHHHPFDPILISEDGIAKAATSTAWATGLTDQKDFAYFIDFSFGTPNQTMRVTADTGSNQLWLGSHLCNSQQRCMDRAPYFNHLNSSSFRNVSGSVPVNITYGKGSVSGFLGTDKLSLGKATLSEQQFLVVDREDDSLQQQMNNTNNGIMGLSFVGGLDLRAVVSTKSKGANVKTVVHNMIAAGLLQKPMFSMWLGYGGSDKVKPNGGEITFGGINQKRFVGDINYYPVTMNVTKGYYWALGISSVQVQGKTIPTHGSLYGIVDSGSSFINVDTATFTKQILPMVQRGTTKPTGAVYYPDSKLTALDCSNVQYLPSFSLSFSSPNATTQANVLTLSPTSLAVKKVIQGKSVCVLGIMPGAFESQAGSVWILGDVFLREYYTVYDFSEGGQIGFADAIDSAASIAAAAVATTTTKSAGVRLSFSFILAALVLLLLHH
ncbi:aspartic peptidase domain-containing protein, partial [Chytriomyces sp. MP71]